MLKRRNLFNHPTVTRVNLPVDRETGRKRGFGFVEMGTEDEEQVAIEALDGANWMGRDMKVNKAKPREYNRERTGFSGSRRNFGGDSRRRY